MVKSKKTKKESTNSEEIDSDIDPQTTVDEDNEMKTNKKKKKIDKQSKKSFKDESDDDENEDSDVEKISKTMKNVNLNKKKGKKVESDGDNDDVMEKPVGKKSKQKKGGFAALMDAEDGDDIDEQLNESEEEVVVKDKSKAPVKKQDSIEDDLKETKGKKSKKSKKKRNESDEDIEKVLAELEMEYSGDKTDKIEPPATSQTKETKKDKKSKKEVVADDEDADDDDGDDNTGTVKTAAQKKKEKKERQKREAAMLKQQAKETGVPETVLKKEKEIKSKPVVEVAAVVESAESKEETSEQTLIDEKKKKKKDKAGDKTSKKADEDKEKSRKGPSKSVVAAMQEQLKKMKEEEERLRLEEEEKDRLLEEAENMRLEQLKLDQERKEKKKQKEKERKERLKAEGKLLSNKQKQDKLRAQAMLEALKAQGLDMPEAPERRPRPGTRVRPNKKQQTQTTSESDDTNLNKTNEVEDSQSQDVKSDETDVVEEPPKEEVKEAWDASSSSESEHDDDKPSVESTPEIEKPPPKLSPVKATTSTKTPTKLQPSSSQNKKQKSESESSDESDDESDDSESKLNDEETHLDAERRKQRVRERIDKRRYDAEQKRSVDNLRAAVVCVLGHVDTGKTKILDKLRRTNVQDGEAGGITQQIGATNVPIEAIKEQTRIVKNFSDMVFKLPGLLIIDTPGHESFSNLRNRGSSLCDIAILVVDIMHGLEPQTIESLNLLKSRKTPFIVALNKIDRLYDWQTMNKKDVRDVIRGQQANTQLEFQQRTKEVIIQFAEQGLNAALFFENPDIRSYVSLVPTSAITGEGMGNLLFLIIESCQNLLAKRLMYSEELLATVLEVKAIPGLGTTIDAILINGKLREGETMIVAGTDGPIVTQIRSLLMPQPLKELRVKNAYIEHREVIAAQGVKIAAKELEKAIAGLNLQVALKPDEVDICKEEVGRELKSALSSIKLSSLGVYVQASTLGSLEALLEFLKQSKIPYAAIRIGPVVKRDVMKASTMLEHEATFATILAFDVKIERDAQDLADSLGVKIFQADIIYHLFDKFMAYRDDLKQKKRDEFKSVAVFPCKLKILPQFIFNSRDPIVMGVMVEAGIVKEGTPICVPTKEFVDLGIVTSIECNHKQVETARKGMEVSIKIDPIPGEAPKMYGRHFEETDMLVSKISRQSIDACKEYFRDDLVKADWALMVELKKQFQIL